MPDFIHNYLQRHVYAIALVSALALLMHAVYLSTGEALGMHGTPFIQAMLSLFGIYAGATLKMEAKSTQLPMIYFGILLALIGSRVLGGDAGWVNIALLGASAAGAYYLIRGQVVAAIDAGEVPMISPSSDRKG